MLIPMAESPILEDREYTRKLEVKRILTEIALQINQGAKNAIVGPNEVGKMAQISTTVSLSGYRQIKDDFVFEGEFQRSLKKNKRARKGAALVKTGCSERDYGIGTRFR